MHQKQSKVGNEMYSASDLVWLNAEFQNLIAMIKRNV